MGHFFAFIARNRLKAIVAVLFLISLAVFAWWLFGGGRVPQRFSFVEGTVDTYRIELETNDKVAATQGNMLSSGGWKSLDSAVDLAATLTVKCYGAADGDWVLGLSLGTPDRHSFRFNGKEMVESAAQFDALFSGREAFLRLSEKGEIRQVSFLPEASMIFKNFMKTLAGELQVILGDSVSRWKAGEMNRRGYSVAEYSVAGGLFDSLTRIVKKKENYRSLALVKGEYDHADVSAQFDITLVRRGWVRSFVGQESISVKNAADKEIYHYDGNISLLLKESGKFDITAPARQVVSTLESYTMIEPVRDRRLEEANFTKIADGLTVEELERLVGQVSRGELTEPEAVGQLIWRAHGLLGLQPELAREMVGIFEQAQTDSRAKKIIMTILTSHSYPETQAAVRDILNGDAARNDRAYTGILQETALITRPERRTVDTVRDILKSEKKDDRYAAAYTLGSMVRTLADNGDLSTAQEYNREITDRLAAATTEEERQKYLMALSNAGREENVSIVKEYLDADDPETRTSAVFALRKTQTDESEKMLVEKTEDRDANVQNSAILTLSKYRNDEPQLRQIQRAIENDAIREQNYYMVLSLLAKNVKRFPELVRDICRLMLEKGVHDNNLAQQIRELMQ